MPLIYCILWNRILRTGIILLKACGQLKSGLLSRNSIFKHGLGALILISTSISAHAAPVGGAVTSGDGAINQAGNTTTINQQSQNLSLNWQQFDIAPKESVHFVQPNAQAIAVNPVLGSNQASQIQGQLHANGQVWLINPNGVMFGKNSIVNVGGLIASTLDIADSERNQTQRQFKGSGTGQIINQGTISTIKGGYVAMIANVVSNQGQVNTPHGTAALAAGSQVTVTFAENHLTGIRVDKSTLNNLVENKQIIRAEGGTVIMTAGARDSLLHSAVNNSGIVEARTLHRHQGNIILLGGMEAGTTTVKGTLDASAPENGDGGTIETSAAHVKIDPEVKITTQSAQGKNGTWFLDPQDYTIAASGGDITGAQISTLLNTNNIIIDSEQGQALGNGDLSVEDAISWSNSNNLTLVAERDVIFSNGGDITNTAGGKLNVRADASATDVGKIVMDGGTINISGTGGEINFYYNPDAPGVPDTFSNVTASSGTVFTAYMLVNTPDQLEDITLASSQNYALGTDLDLSSIPNFIPINNFSGKLTGKNSTSNIDQDYYTISNLTILGDNDNVGLFDTLLAGSVVKDLILSDVSLSGGDRTGALVGSNFGTINNIEMSGTVNSAGAYYIGGVIGFADTGSSGSNINSSVDVNATTDGSFYIGGLVGSINSGATYSNSAVTGSITVALNTTTGGGFIGGFVGYNSGTINSSSYIGTITTPNNLAVGGFVGYTETTSVISHCFAQADVASGKVGNVNNSNSFGGFVGIDLGKIDSCYATGNVTVVDGQYGGGFAGWTTANSIIENSYATGSVFFTTAATTSTNISGFGGFVGLLRGKLTNVYATGDVKIVSNIAGKSVSMVGG